MLGGLVLLLLAGLAGVAGQDPDGTDASAIAVSNGGPWGDWAWPEMCPAGSYTGGGSFEAEPPRGVMEDDTALNGVRLHCSRGGGRGGGYSAESQSGRWGRWSEPPWCPHRGRLVAFTLRVQESQRGVPSDEVAATGAHFACSDGHDTQSLEACARGPLS
ncbi:vitelline membrane outer layer protein 1 homolog [Opisthocomus hoazin]|uniref:vitelline membrane outer layer protein 1 homolog n=1 Tax=Opisthocomus hoazin TaxID=30419 RepID=UPI003F52CCAD